MKNSISLLALLLVFTFASSAQAQTMSPSETFLAYHKAVIAATKPADIFSYYPAKQAAKYSARPAKEKAFSFEMTQLLVGEQKGLKIVSETINGKQATVKTTYCSEGKRGTSEVSMVLEDAAWKIGKVHAKVGLKKCN